MANCQNCQMSCGQSYERFNVVFMTPEKIKKIAKDLLDSNKMLHNLVTLSEEKSSYLLFHYVCGQIGFSVFLIKTL